MLYSDVMLYLHIVRYVEYKLSKFSRPYRLAQLDCSDVGFMRVLTII